MATLIYEDPAGRFGLTNSAEIIRQIESEKIRTSTPEVAALIQQQKKYITSIERNRLLTSEVCPISKLETYRKTLPNIDPENFKSLIRENFYNNNLMKSILCVTNSIFFSEPIEKGNIAPNQRIRRWIKQLLKIGQPSVEGVAFRASFDKTDDVFVIKAPRSHNVDLTHELIVGLQLNKLRGLVPNFAYVFGGFMCSEPILSSDASRKSPLGWCNLEYPAVEYIVYENIVPSVSMEQYCKTASFPDWLSKYMQILFALKLAHDTLDYTHYDLHYQNVLIRTTGISYIPYNTEMGVVYIKTDGVATIIDYGYSHIKLPEGHIGVSDTNLVAHSIYPNTSFQLHDAFKLLMFSALSAYMNKNVTLLEGINRIFPFFDYSEDIVTALGALRTPAYSLAYTSKTSKVELSDLIIYIVENIPEYNSVIQYQVPSSAKILGCIGTDLCMSTEQTIHKLGLDKGIHIDTVFDFCDIVSELEQEGNMQEIENVIKYFDVTTAYANAIEDLNQLINKLNDKSKNLYIFTFSNLSDIMNPKVYSDFRLYLQNIFEIYDTYQQIQVIMECLVTLSKYYQLDAEQIQMSEDYIESYYEDFLKIIDSVKLINSQLKSIITDDVKDRDFPELSILSKI